MTWFPNPVASAASADEEPVSNLNVHLEPGQVMDISYDIIEQEMRKIEIEVVDNGSRKKAVTWFPNPVASAASADEEPVSNLNVHLEPGQASAISYDKKETYPIWMEAVEEDEAAFSQDSTHLQEHDPFVWSKW